MANAISKIFDKSNDGKSKLPKLKNLFPPWRYAKIPVEKHLPQDATANSAFFHQLPAEIRHRILITAFGDWTIHVGLGRRRTRRIFRRSKLTWVWSGSFCHQKPISWRNPPGFDGWRSDWFDDRCYEQNSVSPDHVLPFDHRVGALGWLLTCRQAYEEGIFVIYNGNTMHFHRIVLYRHIPMRLANQIDIITKVELTWHMKPWKETGRAPLILSKGPSQEKIPTIHAFITAAELLPRTFPNARFLYLSLQGDLIHPDVAPNSTRAHLSTQEILKILDRPILRMEKLELCRVALPTSSFATWKFKRSKMSVLRNFRANRLSMSSVWRNLLSPEQMEEKLGVGGYWVCNGKWDMEQ